MSLRNKEINRRKKVSTVYDYPDPIVLMAIGGLLKSFLEVALKEKIFPLLKDNKMSLGQISKRLKMPVPATRMLLQCLVKMGLIQYTDRHFHSTFLSRRYLCGSASSLKWIEYLFGLNKTPHRLSQLLHAPPVNPWYKIKRHNTGIDIKFYSGWLHERRIYWGQELARDYNFNKHKVLLDLGCGSGGWTISILKKYRHLKAILFDLPGTAPIILNHIRNKSLRQRIEIINGSFFEPLPRGADIILVANVFHDWSEADIRKILSNIYRALPSDGELLIREFFLEDNFSGPFIALVQALTVLGPQGQSGWQPSYGEVERILKQACFRCIRRVKNFIIAKK